jgi:hypothetical protein
MYLIHKATIKHTNGLFEVDVLVVKERKIYDYSFFFNSEIPINKFHSFYKQGRKLHHLAMRILRYENVSYELKTKGFTSIKTV